MPIYPKKSLGQHFLTSKMVARDLVRAAEITSEDIVLEVGPGKGFITEELLKKAKKVTAVEKDEKLVEFLKKRFADEVSGEKLEVIHADILKFSPSGYGLKTKDYILIGSIPYYITGRLFRVILESDVTPKTLALIIQKEVAERIVARDGKESLLSLGVKAFGTPQIYGNVPARFFSPQPKVNSAILVVKNISRDFFTSIDVSAEQFFKILHISFAHKRKILLSSIKSSLGVEKEALEHIFNECDIPLKTRPEDLALPKWGCLAKSLRIL